MNKGTLYLIPTIISDDGTLDVIPDHVRKKLAGIHYFFAEDVRTARRFLSSLRIYPSIESLHFSVLNKDTSAESLTEFFKHAYEGSHIGVLSESGCPGVADPGSLAVRFAHRVGIKVIPLVGPSSILLALMASGLNGQEFAFHGYLPIDGKDAAAAVRDFEKQSRTRNQTQIFIETPYRNNSVFQHLVKNLRGDTELCIAVDITGQSERIETQTTDQWRKQSVDLPKKPAIFLFLANP